MHPSSPPPRTRLRRWLVALTVALLGLGTCRRELTLEADPSADAGWCATSEACEPGFMCRRDAGVCVREEPWGEYAARVVPEPCGDGGVLVVDTTGDELELAGSLSDPTQTGPTLSLSEALAIAFYRPGPDTIVFDPAVFPVDAPATIVSTRALSFPGPGGGAPVCVDARHRGVVLDWEERGSWDFLIEEGSLIVGMTFLHVCRPLRLRGTLAGCRWDHDGTRGPDGGAGDYSISSSGQLGPGNSLAGRRTIVSTVGDNLVLDNDFGWDPVSERVLPVAQAIKVELAGRHRITGNVFAGGHYGVKAWGFSQELLVAGNFFGTNRQGDVLPRPETPFMASATPTVTFGPGNVIRGAGVGVFALFIDPVWTLHLTRNRLLVASSTQGGPIFYAATTGPAPPPPPALSVGADGGLFTTCAAPGWLEVFRLDAEGYSEFLWDQGCGTGAPEPLERGAASGDRLVGTLTEANRTSLFSAPLTVPDLSR